MRPTTVFTFLAASVAVLSPVCAAPVPIVGSEAAKRGCINSVCRVAELPSTGSDGSSPLMILVTSMIETLKTFQASQASTNTTTVDLADLSSEPEPIAELDLLADSL